MEATNYVDSVFGAPTREPGNRWAFTYYRPKPIPRTVDLSLPVIVALSEAEAALGQLAGLGTVISDPASLIGPYIRREALASSRIEGTQASLSEVLQAEAALDASTSDDVREVHAYLHATEVATSLSEHLPISQRMLLEVHRALLSGVRGGEKSPGEFRRSPVWVGSAAATPENAPFVPPLPADLPELLTDWEKFVNEEPSELPALVRAALMHYQFETIHPFLDGNGRIGRLLINIMLKNMGRLPHPLLYLSHYFETHRQNYYTSLQGVRERGDLETWLLFFLQAVREQARDGVTRAHRLVEIREAYRAFASQERSNLSGLVELIVANPFVTANSVAAALGLTTQGARNLILKAEGLGWLTRMGTIGRGGRMYWFAQDILDVLESPTYYD